MADFSLTPTNATLTRRRHGKVLRHGLFALGAGDHLDVRSKQGTANRHLNTRCHERTSQNPPGYSGSAPPSSTASSTTSSADSADSAGSAHSARAGAVFAGPPRARLRA